MTCGIGLLNKLSSDSDFLRLGRHDADSYGSCKNVDVAEGNDGLLAGLVLAEKRENVGIAVFYSSDLN